MKKVAREVVRSKYREALSPPFEGGNQLEEYEMVKDNVAEILNNGCFLRGGVDENVSFFTNFIYFLLIFWVQGKTKNLAHPAIEGLAIDIFYTGDDCLASLFPKDFERTIPDHAFALLLTCVSPCLMGLLSLILFLRFKTAWKNMQTMVIDFVAASTFKESNIEEFMRII